MNYLILAGVLIFLLYDHYIPRFEKNIILACIATAIILNFQNTLSDYLDLPENSHLIYARTFASWVGYICRPPLLWALWELQRGKKIKIIRCLFAILTIANILIFTTAFFSHLTFYYDPITYRWQRGPWGLTAHYVMVLMMLLFIPTLIELFFNHDKTDFLSGLLSLLLILGVTIYDTEFNHASLPDAITLEIILYFLFLHVKRERDYSRAWISEQKAEMMLMQIKPHFINNTLSTIQALCEIDPVLAAHTTGNFARYLRGNLTAMDKPLPIPVTEELEHTKIYLEIEMLRFPSIHVEYDIQDSDFNVPVLTIQPLAENAIQHGLRKKKKGILTIRTRATENGHMIQVIDNGDGFDANVLETEKDHGVGTRNVKYRVENICHGTVSIESIKGEGTTVTLLIP